MKSYIKKLVSGNTLLYYLWFKLVRQRTGLKIGFFNHDTNVYIDGYARSGNTFLISLSKKLLPELNIVHHLHTVAPIKIAFLKKLPVFILVRDPMNAISSKYLKHFAMKGKPVSKQIDMRILNGCISDYLYYYDFVSKHKDRITIIKFQKLISSPEAIINQIANKMNLQREVSEEDVEEVNKTFRGATDKFGSSRPNKDKEFYKNFVKNEIRGSGLSPKLEQLYNDLIDEN